MRNLPHYLYAAILVLYCAVPGIGQINPIKTVNELGKKIPDKKDPAPSPSTGSSRPAPAPRTEPAPSKPGTTSSSTTSTTSTTLVLDPAAEQSPAKAFISSFWKAIEKLKVLSAEQKYSIFTSHINSAETSIRNIQLKDPAYNIKPLEAELEKYKAEQQQYRDGRQVARDNMASTMSFLSYLFDENPTFFTQSGSLHEDIAKHKAQLQAFQEKVTQFLASSIDAHTLEGSAQKARDRAPSVAQKAATLEKDINVHTHESGLGLYRELLGLAALWEATAKVYPNVPEAAAAHQQVKAVIARLGTEAQMLARFKQNEQEKIKNTRMPQAIVVNAAIEAEFKKAFQDTGWGETLLKISLLEREWTTLYHQITGNIMARSQRAAIAAKQKDGNCILYEFTIIQEYTGAGKYGPSKSYRHGVIADKFLCEYAK